MSILRGSILAFALTGCFTSWSAIQIGGVPQALDESVRESTVPIAGVQEHLRVRLPLSIEMTYPPAPAPGVTPTTPATPATPKPFAFSCDATQQGSDTVYRSAFRYGKKWKYATAAMFVAEAVFATAFYFAADGEMDLSKRGGDQLASAALALDALGTAVLFFVPRKEIYRSDIKSVTTDLRADCPDGLALDIGGEAFPIDAAGRIGELGTAALDGWMASSPGPGAQLRLTFAGQTIDLPVGYAEQCAWHHHHHPADPSSCPQPTMAVQTEAFALLDVPMGTLTRTE